MRNQASRLAANGQEISTPPQPSKQAVFYSLLAVLSLAAILRTYHIISLFPIVVDESIYLRWAEIIDDQGVWFVSLLDAKQPLNFWVYAVLRKAFPQTDPLLTARLFSASAGVTSSAVLFSLGRRFAGAVGGMASALLYAVFPYGAFYDRLAYTDALLNTFAILFAWASVRYFSGPDKKWIGAALPGLFLGLGFFVKSSMALLVLVPLAAAWIGKLWSFPGLLLRLLVIYAVAAFFPLVSFLMVPQAPVFGTNNLLLHHTDFFTSPEVLLRHPLVNLPQNFVLARSFFASYVTAAFSVVIIVALVYLLYSGHRVIWLFLAAFAIPALFELLTLEYFPSRYLFPLCWVLLLAVGVALGALSKSQPRQIVLPLTLAVSAPLLFASVKLITRPDLQIDPIANMEFLSSGPFSGFGIHQAVDWLKLQTAAGPITVLTDPIWGPPADAVFPYLNYWHGCRVYDAWWMQIPGSSILPTAPTEVLASQYQRVSAGLVDFPRLTRVYYLTDTNYHSPSDVQKSDPAASLVRRFPKRNGADFIDVYRLK